jgi:hypothetical protein
MRRGAPLALLFGAAFGLVGCGGTTTLTSSACQSNRDCPAGEPCISGRCKPVQGPKICHKDSDCTLGQYCDVADGQCKSIMAWGNDASIGQDASSADAIDMSDAQANDAQSNDAQSSDAGVGIDAIGNADASPPPDAFTFDALAVDATAPDATRSDASPPDAVLTLDAAVNPDASTPMDASSADASLPTNLPLGASCTFNPQCVSGTCLAVTLGTTSVQVCTNPCGRSADCPLHFTCANVSGMGFCFGESAYPAPQPSFVTAAGGACSSTSNTCQSGWCNTAADQCLEDCSRPADCGGPDCTTYAQMTAAGTTYEHLCFPPTGGGAPTGTPCLADTDCMSGICDRYQGACGVQCCTDLDCAPAESCVVYDLDPTTPVKLCAPRSTGAGSGALGASCTQPSDCESEVCAPTDPANASSPRKCSTTCCTHADCAALPLGGSCEAFAGPISNTLLGACVPH